MTHVIFTDIVGDRVVLNSATIWYLKESKDYQRKQHTAVYFDNQHCIVIDAPIERVAQDVFGSSRD